MRHDLAPATSPTRSRPPNVRLLFHIGALMLKIKVLEREVTELKARLESREEGDRSRDD